MKTAGTIVFILPNFLFCSLFNEHQADADIWDILGKLIFQANS